MKKNKQNPRLIFMLLLLIISIGAFLRFYNLSEENLWLDETLALKTAKESIPELFDNLYLYEINPPGYFLLSHYWMVILGDSEFALRSLSAILGVVSIFLMFLLGYSVGGRRVGVVSSLIISISMIFVMYSQENLGYSLFTVLIITSFLFLAYMLKNPSLKRYYVLYWLAASAMVYTSYFSSYILFIQYLIVFCFFLQNRMLIRRFILSILGVFILFLPWAQHFLFQMAYWTKNWSGSLSGRLGIPLMIGNLGALVFAIPLIFLFLVLVIAVFLINKYKILDKLKKIKFNQNLFIAAFIVFIVILFLIEMHFRAPIFLTRYTHFFLIPLFVLFSYGLVKTSKNIQTALLLILVILNLIPFGGYYTSLRKEEWKKASDYIVSNEIQNSIILVNADLSRFSLEYYYPNKSEIIGLPSRIETEKNAASYQDIFPRIKSKDRIFYVFSHGEKDKGFYQSRLESDFVLVSEAEFIGVKVYIFTNS